MPENEFEHRVQQKMDAFHLRPSGQVWEEVERRIRKEKRRRFIFWWFLLPLMLTGSIVTGLWLRSSQRTKDPVSVQRNNAIEQSNAAATKTKNDNTITDQQAAVNPVDNSQLNPGTIQPTDVQATASHPSAITTPQAPNNKPRIDTSIAVGKENERIRKKTNNLVNSSQSPLSADGQFAVNKGGGTAKRRLPATAKPTSAEKEQVPVQKPTEPVVNASALPDATSAAGNAPENKPQVNTVTDLSAKNDPVVAAPTALPVTTNNPVTPATDTTATKKTGNATRKKLHDWELSVYAGRSNTVEGFGLFKAKELVATPQTVGGAPPPITAKPSLVRSGFTAGVALARVKDLSPRLQLTLGLGYDYLSTHISVGPRVDSSFNVANSFVSDGYGGSFYRASSPSGQLQNYTNQYHFLSVSASLNWTIIRKKRFSMQWRNELQYRQLIASNMLHFDYGLPGYYKDNSQLHKGIVTLQSGFAVPITKRVQVNPFVSYGINPVLKAPNVSTHYAAMGLRIIFSLPKK